MQPALHACAARLRWPLAYFSWAWKGQIPLVARIASTSACRTKCAQATYVAWLSVPGYYSCVRPLPDCQRGAALYGPCRHLIHNVCLMPRSTISNSRRLAFSGKMDLNRVTENAVAAEGAPRHYRSNDAAAAAPESCWPLLPEYVPLLESLGVPPECWQSLLDDLGAIVDSVFDASVAAAATTSRLPEQQSNQEPRCSHTSVTP